MNRIKNQFPLSVTFDHFFNDLMEFDNLSEKSITSFGNALLNISEMEDFYLVQVIAPGHDKKNFSVHLENEMLIIEAKVLDEVNTNQIKIVRSDYKVSNFKKMVHLDRKVVGEPQKATYENGILQIILPKLKEEATKRTKIQIN